MNAIKLARPGKQSGAFSVVAVIALGAIFVATSVSAKGKDRSAADPYETCLRTGQAAEGVMPAIEDCNRAELHRRDQELNQLYAGLIHRLPSPQVRALKDAERAWIKRRDRTCMKEGAGGAQDENIAFL